MKYKEGQKVIVIEAGHGVGVGRVGVIRDFDHDSYIAVRFATGVFAFKESELAPLIEQPQLEAIIAEREKSRKWLKVRKWLLVFVAISFWISGTYFLLQPRAEFFSNFLVAGVCLTASAFCAYLVKLDIESTELEKLNREL